MTAFNIVRFRVKPGRQEHFVAAHRSARPNFKGFRGGALVKVAVFGASGVIGAALLPVLAAEHLGGGAGLYGALLGVFATGEVLSALLAGSLALRWPLGILICRAQALSGAALVPLAVAPAIATGLVGLALFGAASAPLAGQVAKLSLAPRRASTSCESETPGESAPAVPPRARSPMSSSSATVRPAKGAWVTIRPESGVPSTRPSRPAASKSTLSRSATTWPASVSSIGMRMRWDIRFSKDARQMDGSSFAWAGKAMGGDNHVVACLGRESGGWQLTAWVEAPDAPILYMADLYMKNVRADFGS